MKLKEERRMFKQIAVNIKQNLDNQPKEINK